MPIKPSPRKTAKPIITRPIRVTKEDRRYFVVCGDRQAIVGTNSKRLADAARVAIIDAVHYFRYDNGLDGIETYSRARARSRIRRRVFVAQRGHVEEINSADGTSRDVIARISSATAAQIIDAIRYAIDAFIVDNRIVKR